MWLFRPKFKQEVFHVNHVHSSHHAHKAASCNEFKVDNGKCITFNLPLQLKYGPYQWTRFLWNASHVANGSKGCGHGNIKQLVGWVALDGGLSSKEDLTTSISLYPI